MTDFKIPPPPPAFQTPSATTPPATKNTAINASSFGLVSGWTRRAKRKRAPAGGSQGAIFAYQVKAADWTYLPGGVPGAEPAELTVMGLTEETKTRQPCPMVINKCQRHPKWGWQGRLVWHPDEGYVTASNEAIRHLRGLGLVPAAIATVLRPTIESLRSRFGVNPPSSDNSKIIQHIRTISRNDLVGIVYRSTASWYDRDLWAAPLGVAPDHPERLRALAEALTKAVSEGSGSTALTESEILGARGREAKSILQTAPSLDAVRRGLQLAVESGDLARVGIPGGEASPVGARYAVAKTAQIEAEFLRLIEGLGRNAPALLPEALTEHMEQDGLSEIQQAELRQVFLPEIGAFGLLTGYAGSGKTTCTRSVMNACATSGLQVLACAPTGRAAVRLRQVTGHGAATVHSWWRRLEAAEGEGPTPELRNSVLDRTGVDIGKPVVIFLDEASMISTELVEMVTGITKQLDVAGLYMIGDDAQLPPIAPGFPFFDLLAANACPIGRLTENHRAKRGRGVAQAGREIREGVLPQKLFNEGGVEGDLWFGALDDPSMTLRYAIDIAVQRPDAIQVLVPQHKGDIGTINLNRCLQPEILRARDLGESLARLEDDEGVKIGFPGPDAPQIVFGDRVQASKNDWDADVANGDVGEVLLSNPDGIAFSDAMAIVERPLSLIYRESAGLAADPDGPVSDFGTAPAIQVFAVVDYGDGRVVAYHRKALQELRLAYAISVHGSQGGEWPLAVVICDRRHQPWSAQRELIYTACTRAAEGLYVLGQWSAMAAAVSGVTSNRRVNVLSRLLQGEVVYPIPEPPEPDAAEAADDADAAQEDDFLDGIEMPF